MKCFLREQSQPGAGVAHPAETLAALHRRSSAGYQEGGSVGPLRTELRVDQQDQEGGIYCDGRPPKFGLDRSAQRPSGRSFPEMHYNKKAMQPSAQGADGPYGVAGPYRVRRSRRALSLKIASSHVVPASDSLAAKEVRVSLSWMVCRLLPHACRLNSKGWRKSTLHHLDSPCVPSWYKDTSDLLHSEAAALPLLHWSYMDNQLGGMELAAYLQVCDDR